MVQPVSKPQRQAAVRFIFATAVLDVVAMGVMIPVLPNLIRTMVGGDTAVAADYTMIFTVTWGLMQFVCSPILGMLSDRFGRRPVLLISIFGLGIDYLVMALAPNLIWLYVGRVINGITASSFSTANAYVADVTEPQDRAKAFGMMGAAFGIGFIVGPAIGGWLGGYNLRWPFYLSAALALVNWLYGLFVLPESLPSEKRAKGLNWTKANPLGALELLRSKPGLVGLISVNFLYQMAHVVFPSIFVLFVGHRFGWGPREAATMLVATGALSVVVQLTFVGRAVKALGERRALIIGMTAQITTFVIYALAPTPTIFYVGLLIGGLGGLISPSLQGLMSGRVLPSEQGRLQGASSALMGISSIIGPALYLSVFAFALRHETSLGLPGLPILIAAALCSAAMVAALRYAKPQAASASEL
jgi:DHA1 family tetracycline resistance protein-like MFS transporter